LIISLLKQESCARVFEYLMVRVIVSIKLMEIISTISKVDLVMFFLNGTSLFCQFLLAHASSVLIKYPIRFDY